MARSQELDKDFDPRHRVVGAIILVTIAVIVLPLILDEHPTFEGTTATSEETVTSSGAGSPSRIVVKKIVSGEAKPDLAPEEKKPETVAKKLASESKAAVTPSTESRNTPTADKPAAAVVDKKKEDVKPAPVVSSAKVDTGEVKTPHWAVQVGTFSNASNVRRLSKQLKEHGYSVMQKSVPLKQGTAVRVRVGPFSSRASADKAQAAINKQIGVKGVVVAGP